ncbi:malto-oligosyltrehalose synthase [soil metagenome]
MTAHLSATYRLQLGPDLDLFGAAGLVDYLVGLGISHIYCSPLLQAAPDSTHGYAVVDYGRVDDRLGGEEGRRHLIAEAQRLGLGIVVDLVPNHMAVSLPANQWFSEVLEHGPSARHAAHFDIDWDPPEASTPDRVLLAILGDHYGREVESGSLEIHHTGGRFTVRYHDHILPASPRSVGSLLAEVADLTRSEELAFAARALASLPPPGSADEPSRRRRSADARVLADTLTGLAERPALSEAIDATVDRVNHSPDDLDRFLELQNYRLARWRTASQELGYRRFFDIDSLIGLRIEDPEVFTDSHSLLLTWTEAGEVDGLRVDHPDGLRRPGEYLSRLRAAAPSAWIVVEKILEGDEELSKEWPVDGTTGYEFLNDVTALFVDTAAEDPMTNLWSDIVGSEATWEEVATAAKREVLSEVLAADLNRLTTVFVELCKDRRRFRDFTRAELSAALSETLVGFAVYRTYVTEEGDARPADIAHVESAIEAARLARPDLDSGLFDLLSGVLVARLTGPTETELRMRFQQLSGPVMAKGVEDTAFYRYLRLAALCDVGGDPALFGHEDPGAFHERRLRSQDDWPTTMLSLSTHDTKRSEDVRARLTVLSEIPDLWGEYVGRWRVRNADHRPAEIDGATEYLMYQTFVGAYPLELDRLIAYVEKATKEAKLHTSWTDPDPSYDDAVKRFAGLLYDDSRFRSELDVVVEEVLGAGRINSLAQKTLQLTCPGIPDLYQGTELWDLSLVDPDNRRPVDFALRRRLLGDLDHCEAPDVLSRMDEGLPKLWLIVTLLGVRRDRPDAFGSNATYRPLAVSGVARRHAVAYTRSDQVVVIVPRLTIVLESTGGWGDTNVDLPAGEWRDVFSRRMFGGTVEVRSLLQAFPVAVLEKI